VVDDLQEGRFVLAHTKIERRQLRGRSNLEKAMIPIPKLNWTEVEELHKHLLERCVVRACAKQYRNRNLPVNVGLQRRRFANIAEERPLTAAELNYCYPHEFRYRVLAPAQRKAYY